MEERALHFQDGRLKPLLARGALDQPLEKVLLERTQVNRTRLRGEHKNSLLLVLPCILSYSPILRYF
jgi:hypothetical protein